jgi:ribonuclease BN (tRNA processing enzyme)
VAPLVSHPLGLGSIDFFNVVFDFRPVAPVIEVGGLRFESFRTVHPVETYGFRITEGDGTFVYTADTADFPELAEDCRDAEVLLCEATFVRPNEGPPGIHMWAHESGRLAAKADAKRLVLTHVWATNPLEDAVAAASSAFDGPVEAAVEEAVYSVP